MHRTHVEVLLSMANPRSPQVQVPPGGWPNICATSPGAIRRLPLAQQRYRPQALQQERPLAHSARLIDQPYRESTYARSTMGM
jgi:hypothetical protein